MGKTVSGGRQNDFNAEQLSDLELPDMPRTPAEIKKDIKHEKNPMRLKQLNKELNESYKWYKRK